MSSMKYPYRDLGATFDRQFRNDLNANFDDIEHDIRMIGGEAAQQALEAAYEAETQAIYAQTSGDYAQDKGDYAAQQGDYAKTQGDYAKAQGDYAKAQADYAKQVADENKTRWLNPVATFADIATTYPSPQLGWTVMTLDDGKIYRYDGSTWQFTQQYNSTALNNLANELSKQNQQSTTIGHGLNVINASQNSPLDVRIEGRTLVNLLGRAGNCEDASKWQDYQATHTTDSNNFVYGTSGMKVTLQSGFTSGSTFLPIPGVLKANKYYVLIGEVKNGNAASVRIRFGGAEGNGLGDSTPVTDTSKFKIVWVKVNPTTDKEIVNVDLSVEGSGGQYGYFDGIRLYEITAEEYANIGTVWNDEEVAKRYPYVDSVQHVQNPYVIAEGENLLPPFSEWNIHPNAVVREPYKLELNATAQWQESTFDVPIVTGQSYTLNLVSNGFIVVRYYDKNKAYIFDTGQILSFPFTFTPPVGTAFIQIVLSNRAAGTFTFTNPMLTVGNQSKPFVPRNPSYLFAEVKLGSLAGKKDILWKDGQDWKVLKWVKSETLTITNNTATLANNAQGDTAIIVDEPTGEIYKRVVALSGSGKEFTQGGSGNKTITFNKGYVPTSPKAHYVLATPQTIVVTDKVEGDLVVNGSTQIEVGSGVVIREKVIPYLDANNTYRINNHWEGNSDLKYKTTKILKIYKSSIDNTSVWTIRNDNDNGYANGNAWAYTQKTNFDQTAEYTVTYLVLDRHLFTTNILAVTATYDSSLKSVVDSVVAKQSDIAAQVSVNVRAIAELYKRVKALGG